MSRRAFVIVLDAVGVGELPDAAEYGDAGTDTLGHLSEALDGGLDLPALGRLGLGSIIPLVGVPPAERPGVFGRLHPLGPGKDSTNGHWELMGVVSEHPMPTYPDGFPPEVVALVEREAGRGTLLNRPYNGVQAIEDYGDEHLATGKLILYTSADPVLQIAAHHDVLSEAELHDLCARIRAALEPPHEVGRVIARPFTGPSGAFERTTGRHDYSLAPPTRSYLEELADAGVPVHAVGKVFDLFTGRGISDRHAGKTNAESLAQTGRLFDELDHGLVFTNCVETDQNFGHRGDLEGFHGALRAIDAAVAGWLERLGPDDLLVLTADHGVDMTTPGSDHTREYAPLLAVAGEASGRHDGPLADVGATCLRWLTGRSSALPGTPFA